MATNTQQLLLQIDASVELARRNIAQLSTSVGTETSKMQTMLDRVDASFENFGKGLKTGAAEKSAEAFIAGFSAAEASAKKLLASIDPLFAAEQRYIEKLKEANDLNKIGAMSGDQLARVQTGLKTAFDEEAAALGRKNNQLDESIVKERAAAAAAEEHAEAMRKLAVAERDATEGNNLRQAIDRNTQRGTREIDPSTGAFRGSGKSAQASAGVFEQAFDKVSRDADRAAASAAKLVAQFDPLYAAQKRYNAAVDEAEDLHSRGHLSAQRLMQVRDGLRAVYEKERAALDGTADAADRLAKEEDELAAAADRLRGKIDPLYNAQKRFDAELHNADVLLDRGKISQAEYAASVEMSRQALQRANQAVHAHGDALKSTNRTSGQVRLGMQNLSFQVNDIATQFALGARPQQIFAAQAGQVVAAFQMMGHEGNKFVRFLGGPWGIAISLAISALTYFSMKNKEAEESVGSLIKKMQEQELQTRRQKIANEIWADSIDGVIEAQMKLNEELDKELSTKAGEDRLDLTAANDRLAQQQKQREAAIKNLVKLEADVAAAQEKLAQRIADPQMFKAASVGLAQRELKKVTDQLIKARDEFKRLDQGIKNSELIITKAENRVKRNEAEAAFDVGAFFTGVQNLASRSKAYTEEMALAIAHVSEASQDAAEAVPGAIGKNAPLVNDLVQSFLAGKTSAAQFAKAMEHLALAVKKVGDEAKEAQKKTDKKAPYTNATFALPFEESSITSGFGNRKAPMKGASTVHQALDFAKPEGTAVRNPGTVGIVIHSGKLGGYGNAIIVDHGAGTMTQFNHLATLAARKGQVVGPNDVLGTVGSTGTATGAHLDYKLKVRNKYVDPRKNRNVPVDEAAVLMRGGKTAEQMANRQNREELSGMKWANSAAERLEGLNNELIAATMELLQGTEKQAEYAALLVEGQHKRVEKDIENDAAEAKKAGLDSAMVDAQTKLLKEKNDQVRDAKIANVETKKQLALAREANQLEQQRTNFLLDDKRFEESRATNRKEVLKIQLEIVDLMFEQKQRDLEYLKLQAERNGNIAEANRIQEQINRLPTEREQARGGVEDANRSPMEDWMRDARDTTDEIERLKVQGLEGLVDVLVAAKDGWKAMRDVALSAITDILAELWKIQMMKMVANIFGSAMGAGAGSGAGAGAAGGSIFSGTVAGTMGWATGGHIKGPGTGTSDSIPIWASNGEFMVNAEATKKHLPLLKMINDGRSLPRFAKGGAIGSLPKAANVNVAGTGGGGDTYHLNIRFPGHIPPAERRKTGAQVASGFQAEIARTKRRGM